ncbi:MAG: TetR/AcrR family transcriptional regulator [Terriglobales bacterium]
MTIATKSRLGSRRRPEESRAAILEAAVREFANEGIAGARTDAIARAAKVNKALLYYYFKDKEALHAAVLKQVFGGLKNNIYEAMTDSLPPPRRILAYAGAHFDYIAGNPLYPRIVQAEMMRAGRGNSRILDRIVNQYLYPIISLVKETLRQGVRRGEFRDVDPMNFIPSMIAVIVFHFNSAPVLQTLTGLDPMSPQSLAARRAAVLDFISAALFTPAYKNQLNRTGRRNTRKEQRERSK